MARRRQPQGRIEWGGFPPHITPVPPPWAFPIRIDSCEQLEQNTLVNPSWLLRDYDMVHRYPGVPSKGGWRGTYRDLMRFRTLNDVGGARGRLRKQVWQSDGMIGGTYTRVGALDVDHYVYEIDMAYWVATSRCWLYPTSATATGTLLIVHGGHDNQGPEHAALIDIRTEALAAGHDVLVCSMPGQSVNATPGPTGDYFGANGPMASHNNLPFWDRAFLAGTSIGGSFGVPPESGLHPFLAPVHRMINALAGNYDRIAMTGLSGGASTALKCAALDTRITNVYPVSGGGCIPRFVYFGTKADFGDNEDQVRTWLDVANEEETLAMITSGGRRGIVFLNDEDPVYGAGYDLADWAPAAIYEAKELGGRLRFVYDNNSSHSWSAATRARILNDLEISA